MKWFYRIVADRFLEQPARARGIAVLITTLERGASETAAAISKVPDVPTNREQARHIVGIERWAQRRLRTILGEAPTDDELDGYLPPDGPVAELASAFTMTRARTLEYARQIQQQQRDAISAEHTQFGALTARAWLRYLHLHATIESRRMG